MRTCSFWLWVSLTLFVAGCGNNEPDRAKVYPARGSVSFKGKPAAGAIVRVHDVSGALVSRGVVQKDGTFALTTNEAGDGIPAGRYRVSVYWRRQTSDDEPDGPSLLPDRYSRPESSGLEIEVRAEPENKLSPFILKP